MHGARPARSVRPSLRLRNLKPTGNRVTGAPSDTWECNQLLCEHAKHPRPAKDWAHVLEEENHNVFPGVTGYHRVTKPSKNADIPKMAENCINCIGARPTPPSQS